jgi:hypothetical protein
MIHCIPTSNGEILDKLSILLIKKDQTLDTQQLININNEINHIKNIADSVIAINNKLIIKNSDLKNINKKLWDIEDKIRNKEKLKQFDQEFIDLARKVYIYNDIRAKIKKEINKLSNSLITEEKIYDEY